MTATQCPRCGEPVAAGSRFCKSCGAQLAQQPVSPANLTRYAPWILTGILGLVLVILVARRSGAPATQQDAEPPSRDAQTSPGAPPDISNLSPAQRFERLYQRVISAAQGGDQATVSQFMPMATAAFGMLDTVTVDARYHMAMLELHVGDMSAAQAQADTIRQGNPDHLFSYVIVAAVARWKKDDRARDAAYREFMKRYDREIATKKPEYTEHQSMLDEVKRAATGGKAG